MKLLVGFVKYQAVNRGIWILLVLKTRVYCSLNVHTFIVGHPGVKVICLKSL